MGRGRLHGGRRLSFRTPLSRAQGLGAAGHGTSHFWAQRVSAVALIPLSVWFVYSIAAIADARYEAVRAWASQPASALLLAIFVVGMFYHAQLGIQVVIEDYVHTPWLRVSSLVLLRLLVFLLSAAALFAVLRIALGS